MSFVFYDIETTGRNRHFDQILQFAAVKTNLDFEEIDRFEVSCRLQPHILPAPRALCVNGLRLSAITDPSRQSHYDMVSAIHWKLASWSPAMFLGYNSIKFDDEFIRNAFYQCLYPPYITNTRPNIRGDVLRLVRAFSVVQPYALSVPIEGGRPSFALGPLAIANGFPEFKAHEAMGDVRATAFLCSVVAKHDETLWSQFQRCAQKASAQCFLEEQDAVMLCDASARRRTYIATLVGRNREAKLAHVFYCLNLNADIESLRRCSDAELDCVLSAENEFVQAVKVNACPVIFELADVPSHLMGGRSESDWRARGRSIRKDSGFLLRLLEACERTERKYPPSMFVEEQLYEGGFWPDSDKFLMESFHRQPWGNRLSIAKRLSDKRLKQLSRRLIFIEYREAFSNFEQTRMEQKLRDRLFAAEADSSRWTTISRALREIDQELLNADLETVAQLQEYGEFLRAL